MGLLAASVSEHKAAVVYVLNASCLHRQRTAVVTGPACLACSIRLVTCALAVPACLQVLLL